MTTGKPDPKSRLDCVRNLIELVERKVRCL